MGTVKSGTVCVVTETPTDRAEKIVTRGPYLYGVFSTEEVAREDYGDVDAKYVVTFDVLPLWVPEVVAS